VYLNLKAKFELDAKPYEQPPQLPPVSRAAIPPLPEQSGHNQSQNPEESPDSDTPPTQEQKQSSPSHLDDSS